VGDSGCRSLIAAEGVSWPGDLEATESGVRYTLQTRRIARAVPDTAGHQYGKCKPMRGNGLKGYRGSTRDLASIRQLEKRRGLRREKARDKGQLAQRRSVRDAGSP
jgi:hypothetical protein